MDTFKVAIFAVRTLQNAGRTDQQILQVLVDSGLSPSEARLYLISGKLMNRWEKVPLPDPYPR